MPKTDDINTVAGIYHCTNCGERITMPHGHKFPDCPKCHGTGWALDDPTK